jgi:hypothetical protein
MISEPEMAGEFGAAETREVMSSFDRKLIGERRRRRPWLWALAGMVMASALWAATLFVYGWGDPKPDMRGYQLAKDPCPSLRLESIGAAIAPRESTTAVDSGLLNQAALDQIQCFIPLRPRAGAERARNGWSIDYAVGITVALHKRIDPGVEFEARRRVTDFGVVPEAKVETVPGLGDKTYLLSRDDNNAELRVLEGGAVLSLNLSVYTQYQNADDDNDEDVVGDGPDIPDLSP